MDKVTHFLFIVALVLIIIICIMWIFGTSCAAGAISKNIIPLQTSTNMHNIVEKGIDYGKSISDKIFSHLGNETYIY